MKRFLSAPLTFAVLFAVPAFAELQPRKVPATPAIPVKPGPGAVTPSAPGETPGAPAVPKTPAVPAVPAKPGPGPGPGAVAPAVTEEGDPKLSADLSAKLLKQLDDVEKNLGGKRGAESQAMIKLLKEASAGKDRACNLWLDCKKEVDFDLKGKTATEWSEWRRKEGKALELNDGFCSSLQLQAQFLALALLDSHAATPEQRVSVMNEANTYLDTLAKICERQEGLSKNILGSIMDAELNPDQDITMDNLEESLKQVREAAAALGGDIMDSMYAKKLKPESCVGERKPSATHPGNLDEIYENLIMKVLRDKKDAAALAAAWTKRIALVAGIAKDTKVKELTERYENEKLPVLKWLQARDQWRCGQMEAAAANMLAVIRANPGHKECQNWTRELRGLAAAN